MCKVDQEGQPRNDDGAEQLDVFYVTARRHDLPQARKFTQDAVRRHFAMTSRLGLCAGLVHVWWVGLQTGEDLMERVCNEEPQVLSAIVRSQGRSVYSRRGLVATPGHLEKELLIFKYGVWEVSDLAYILSLFEVQSFLELDLCVLYRTAITGIWTGCLVMEDVLRALVGNWEAGLRVVIMRHVDETKTCGESGHRVSLNVDKGGACRFYDPRWGEVCCRNHDQFLLWYKDYWVFERFDRRARKGVLPYPEVQVYTLLGALSSEAERFCNELEKRFVHALTSERLESWLKGQSGLLVRQCAGE